MTDLSKPQIEILKHTNRRSANRMFCGSETDPDMLHLIELGLMKRVGSPGFLPDGDAYFTITAAGNEFLAANNKRQ